MIRLIVTDIDETIVKEGSTNINPQYFEVIRKLTDKGIEFVAASGRHISSLQVALAPVADKIWFLSQNGSIIKKQDQTLVPNPLQLEWIPEFWKEMEKIDAPGAIAYTPDYCFIPFSGNEMHRHLTEDYHYAIKVTGGWDTLPTGEIFTMMTVYHPEDADAFCKANLNPDWHNRLQILAAGQTWVDLVPAANGKGPALKKLCQDLAIDPSEVIAFGDNMNDLSMIEFAGCGIAVENAKPAVKAVAQKIVPDYTKDGVLHELEAILAQL
ncbi:MAG: HAD family hydrolase [Lachnospiraceae bacterium]|nr:HAD family hydrolase [Lachnospiraceae bacterium]